MKNNRLRKGKSYNRHQQVILEVNYKNQVTLEPKKSQHRTNDSEGFYKLEGNKRVP